MPSVWPLPAEAPCPFVAVWLSFRLLFGLPRASCLDRARGLRLRLWLGLRRLRRPRFRTSRYLARVDSRSKSRSGAPSVPAGYAASRLCRSAAADDASAANSRSRSSSSLSCSCREAMATEARVTRPDGGAVDATLLLRLQRYQPHAQSSQIRKRIPKGVERSIKTLEASVTRSIDRR